MIESFGPRQTATSGPAATLQNGQPGDKVVHRSPTRVLPAEPVDKSAQTGPRPYFGHTYLEQVAAYWPNEPEPPVTRVAYEVPEPEVRDATVEDRTVDIRR
jgi:hypothetical protein